MLEPLEPRQLRSGTVTVTTDFGPNHVVLIKGDAAANEVAFDSSVNTGMEGRDLFLVLTVYNGKLIVNGKAVGGAIDGSHAYATRVGGDPLYGLLFFDLGGGDDHLSVTGDDVAGIPSTEIMTGDGNDRVNADGGFFGLKVNTGAGNDKVALSSTLAPLEGLDDETAVSGVSGDLNVFTGPGHDRVTMSADNQFDSNEQFLVRGKLRIVDNSGPTYIGLYDVRALRGVTFATGDADDVISLKSCRLRGKNIISTRGGNDIIRFGLAVDVDGFPAGLMTGAGHDVFTADRYYEDLID